jgi:BON domain-containing protein
MRRYAQDETDLLCGMFGGPVGEVVCLLHRSDDDLAGELTGTLGTHAALAAGRVRADVEECWVTLEGDATEVEWREIERMAIDTLGVAGIRRSPCHGSRKLARRRSRIVRTKKHPAR